MIIISQDRKQFMNFERVTNFWIDDNEMNRESKNYEIYADGELLGNYKTEERAVEVLESIAAVYQAYKLLACTSDIKEQNKMAEKLIEKGIKPFKFEMPEE